MGNLISREHSAIFDDGMVSRLLRLPRLLYDAVANGKAVELTSFGLWEMQHRFGLVNASRYLRFAAHPMLVLRASVECGEEDVEQVFASHELTAIKSQVPWRTIYLSRSGTGFGSLNAARSTLFRSASGRDDKAEPLHRFADRIRAVFVSRRNTVFACSDGVIYRGVNGGERFSESLRLTSRKCYFLFGHGMTETPEGMLVLAEYGTVHRGRGFQSVANLYFSFDEGASWEKSDFLVRAGANKHVHIVAYSKELRRLFVTDGDNKKRLWVSEELRKNSPPRTGR